MSFTTSSCLHALGLLAGGVFASSGLAEQLRVSPVPGAAPYQSIQTAVNDAEEGDTIVLGPGVYTSDDPICVADLQGKQLHLVGGAPAEQVVIDCEFIRAGIICRSGEGEKTTIQGITVRNSRVFNPDWGHGLPHFETRRASGILCDNSSPTIQDCIFLDNQSGIYLYQSDSLVESCRFEGHDSAGVTVRSDRPAGTPALNTPKVRDCVFTNNQYCTAVMGSDLLLDDCIYVGNDGAINIDSSGTKEPNSNNPSHLTMIGCEVYDLSLIHI